MKKDIHPKYYAKAKVSCACGASFEVGSTQPEVKVEICSACHPFYTGEQKYVDTARRVEKFEELRQKAAKMKAGRKSTSKREKRAKKAAKKNVKKSA